MLAISLVVAVVVVVVVAVVAVVVITHVLKTGTSHKVTPTIT